MSLVRRSHHGVRTTEDIAPELLERLRREAIPRGTTVKTLDDAAPVVTPTSPLHSGNSTRRPLTDVNIPLLE